MDLMPLKVNFFISHQTQTECQKTFMLKMKSGQVIPYTDICNYLGNVICSHNETVIIDNAITDMKRRLNNLLVEFSHYDSGTLSTLFRTYYMNEYIWMSNVEL